MFKQHLFQNNSRTWARDFCGRLTVIIMMLLPISAFALTEQEIADLQFMREEEKLAYDLYNALYTRWGNPVFSTIAIAEARHQDSVVSLLTRYSLADPAQGMAAGKYNNAELQSLYDQLLESGYQSEIEGLRVGVQVELADIEDLDNAILRTSDSSIVRVYNNLRRGSLNHLSSFTNEILALGGEVESSSQNLEVSVYEPVSQSLYIPAITTISDTGETLVYDALLRLVETIPQTLELVNLTQTNVAYSAEYASYSAEDGSVTIPNLAVGTLNYSSLEEVSYTATLQLKSELSELSPTFVILSLTEK